MTDKQKNLLKGGIQALRDNPLKAKGIMKDHEGGRCCLCVLQDHARENSDVEQPLDENGEPYFPKLYTPSGAYFSECYGFEFDELTLNEGKLMEWNDGWDSRYEEKSHKEIADMLEKHFDLG